MSAGRGKSSQIEYQSVADTLIRNLSQTCVSACDAQMNQMSKGEKEGERVSSIFASLLSVRPFTGLIDGDTDVEEEQLLGALRCN